jgi:hypothetical protein
MMTTLDFDTMSRAKIQEQLATAVTAIGSVLQEYFEDSGADAQNGIHNHLKEVRHQLAYFGFPPDQTSITFICLGGNSTLKASFNAGKHGWIHSN